MALGLDSLLDEVHRLHGVVFGRDGDAFTLTYAKPKELRLTAVHSGQHVELCAEVASVPPDRAVDIMARALRANMDPADTGPGYLVLDKNRPVLLLRERHALDFMDGRHLAHVLTGMIDRARGLQTRLTQAEPRSAPLTADAQPAWSAAAHSMIRG